MAFLAYMKIFKTKESGAQWVNTAPLRFLLHCLMYSVNRVIRFFEIEFLFTKRDLKTIVIPQTLFGVICAISGPALTTNETPHIRSILLRVPKVVLWNWLNLFIFNVSNQRLPPAIKEDIINKPWRVLPSRLLTEAQAKRLLLYAIPAVTVLSAWLGAVEESISLTVLDWMYNNLGGSEEIWMLRNLNNALGYVFYGSASIRLACGFPQHTLNTAAVQWLAIVVVIITFSMQVQDLADQKGDALVGRRTAPLELGDVQARWLSMVAMELGSVMACCFWEAHLGSWAAVLTLATAVGIHLLLWRHIAADNRSFSLWCCWLCIIYSLPIIS